MPEFDLVAMGGTFDIIHRGHITLLSKAFEISSKVIIGLTSDDLAKSKGKKIINSYEKRLENLDTLIKSNFENPYQISKLENDFGPAVLERGVQALVVSGETSNQGDVLNKLRAEKNLPPVQVITVPMVLAEDGDRISTSRIKNLEIDAEGKLSRVD
jgi:pantetheine-phosphate adenylyltransferase